MRTEEEVTLWYLRRTPTAEERAACMEFLMPMFELTTMEKEMRATVDSETATTRH